MSIMYFYVNWIVNLLVRNVLNYFTFCAFCNGNGDNSIKFVIDPYYYTLIKFFE